jgi:putative flippase GtrA
VTPSTPVGSPPPGTSGASHAASGASLPDATSGASPPAGGGAEGVRRAPQGTWKRRAARPLVRKVTGYSAGSVIAAVTSEAAFAAAYGWGHSGTTLASLAGFVGGAIPNYFLNRRWAWKERGGRSRRREILLYALVSLASFGVSALVTNRAETVARHATASHGWQVALVALAYLAVSGVFFVAKFVAYELVVFTKGPRPRSDGGGPSDASATTS